MVTHSPRDLTPLPDLLHGAARAGPVRTRRPVYLDLLPPCNDGCAGRENKSRPGWATPRTASTSRPGASWSPTPGLLSRDATQGAERFPPSAHRSNA